MFSINREIFIILIDSLWSNKWNRSTFDRTSLPAIQFQIHLCLIFENDNEFEKKKRNKKFPEIVEAMNSFDLSIKSKRHNAADSNETVD